MQDNIWSYEARRLLSPAAGRIIPIHELVSGENSRRYSGEGFSVSAAEGIMGFLFGTMPAVEICAPTSGAIIAEDEDGCWFKLRTGDGLELSVELSAPAEFFKQPGDLARTGECVCRISQEDFRSAPAGVIVTFPDSSRITELHVISGIKRSGKPAAEYKIRKE